MFISRLSGCLGAAGLILLAHAASAEPPREITVPIDGTIQLQVGETRFFQFDRPIDRITVPVQNLVDVTPRNETTFAFKGVADGVTIVELAWADGKGLQRMQVIVGPHTVKIYGLPDEADFVAFKCDPYGCGAGEGSNRNKPSAQSVTTRLPTQGGGFIERTKSYQ